MLGLHHICLDDLNVPLQGEVLEAVEPPLALPGVDAVSVDRDRQCAHSPLPASSFIGLQTGCTNLWAGEGDAGLPSSELCAPPIAPNC